MKRKYTGIIMAILIMIFIVTFTMIGCKNTINARPAATAATTVTTTAATTAK
jgi:hypothetical protein